MISEIEKELIEELKDPEFAKSYGAEGAKSEIGLTLFHARQKSGLTQKELAEKLGVSQPYIAQIESGEANLTFDTAGRMLAVLGLQMVIDTKSIIPRGTPIIENWVVATAGDSLQGIHAAGSSTTALTVVGDLQGVASDLTKDPSEFVPTIEPQLFRAPLKPKPAPEFALT